MTAPIPGVTDAAVLTVREVATALRVHPNAVYKLIAAGLLPAFRVGRSIRISRSALLAFVGLLRREGGGGGS